jgi:hypothetical protein
MVIIKCDKCGQVVDSENSTACVIYPAGAEQQDMNICLPCRVDLVAWFTAKANA